MIKHILIWGGRMSKSRISGKKSSLYKKSYNRRIRKDRYSEFIIRICAVISVFILIVFFANYFINKKSKLKVNKDAVAAFNISYSVFDDLKKLSTDYNEDFIAVLAYYAIDNDFFADVASVHNKQELQDWILNDYKKVRSSYSEKDVKPFYEMLSKAFNEIKYFPIPIGFSGDGQNAEYMYGNSWGAKREYGGERIHKGTDITDRENVRGRIPIVSMTDGIIENIGWNELGGYRIGIRTENNTYYYYAHFESFKQGLSKGDEIKAGSLLGYMGDTGYSKNEGTTGNFIVHLHVGIAFDIFEDEFWINPYIFLRNIEDKKVLVY